MLGDSDDLAAVLSVLDRLSNELETNRSALEETCEKADNLSEGVALPQGIAGLEPVDVLERQVQREKRDCEYLQESLERAMDLASVMISYMRTAQEAKSKREMELQRTASQELLAWQNEVERSAAEYADLVSKNMEVCSVLTRLYEKLQVPGSSS